MIRELVTSHYITLGCDPEIFATRIAGKVSKRVAPVSSEHVIPVDGLRDERGGQMVTRDGVQIELHAGGYSGCRQSLACSIKAAMRCLQRVIVAAHKKDPSIAISFRPLVTLTKREMAALSPEARELNCKPSLNAYGREPVQRDGNIYTTRTASGHVHLGTTLLNHVKNPNDVVKVCDLLVGVPCVLVDQNKAQRIRRETYGRAGEYRRPAHGLEYRVPGNFWLLDYKLMSMVFGLAKLANSIAHGIEQSGSTSEKWAYKTLTKDVDFAEVEHAINENDVAGALRIYINHIRPFVQQIQTSQGLSHHLLNAFEYFIEMISQKGLKHWFDVDDAEVLRRWTELNYNVGWERFLAETVATEYNNSKFTGIVLPAKTQKLAA